MLVIHLGAIVASSKSVLKHSEKFIFLLITGEYNIRKKIKQFYKKIGII